MKNCTITLLSAVTFLLLFTIAGCDKKEDFPTDAPGDYFQLTPGKYIIYRLDSMGFTDFGQQEIVSTYQAKDVVDAELTDNLGRKCWRIHRFIRDFNSTNEADWEEQIAYLVTPTRTEVEVFEDNYRFVKLKGPIKNDVSWLGNGYLPFNPYAARYQFSNDNDIRYWNYNYTDVGTSDQINNKTYENTITVPQVADSMNVPVTAPNALGWRNYWLEKYAKGIGLIYKEVTMWEYQPARQDKPAFRTGFGIKLSIMDHN